MEKRNAGSSRTKKTFAKKSDTKQPFKKSEKSFDSDKTISKKIVRQPKTTSNPENIEKKRPVSSKLLVKKTDKQYEGDASTGKKIARKEGRSLGSEKTNSERISTRKKKDDSIRLNKFIADAGICSRREADTYISTGLVTVNGVLVTELGSKVLRTDIVKFNGKALRTEKLVYILMNKPKDAITTVTDTHERKTVLDILGNAVHEKVYPVGRLDRSTTGVLLITNDGDLTKKLTHPSYNKKKIYHVFLDKNVSAEHLRALTTGVQLDDEFIKFDVAHYALPDDKTEVGVELHTGQNRVVRRMFEHLGYKVRKLDRVYFAGLTKKNLARGKWRFLTEQEISMLKMGAYE